MADWYEQLGRVENHAVAAQEAIGKVIDLLRLGKQQHLDGHSPSQVVKHLIESGGVQARLNALVAVERFERSVTVYRGVAIRLLVDEKGMTFSEVGRLIGVSRQMVARLYNMDEAKERRLT